MASPFMGEIRIFPFSFAPRGWAWCNGQLLPVEQNKALFSLLHNTYGGDGQSDFALPDLQGRVPMHPGQDVSVHELGDHGGSETVALSVREMPAHTHTMNGDNLAGNLNDPANAVLSRPFLGGYLYKTVAGASIVALSDQSIEPEGGDQPHNNLMPYLTLNFCIALQGIFPNRPSESDQP
jgi:microcystin-dependent protein